MWSDVQTASRSGDWPEPVAFSYAAPAREAAQWWSSIKSEVKGPVDPATPLGTQTLTVAQVRQSQGAAREMARLHQDDPPLLLAWQAKGQSWRIHLTAVEAASTTRFLPQPQKWGVPSQEVGGNSLLIRNLIPEGSPSGMTPQGGQPLSIWPSTNTLNWKMLYLLSHSTTRAFPSQMNTDIHFKLRAVYDDTSEDHVLGRLEMRQEAQLAGNVMHYETYANKPIPSFHSALRQRHSSDNGPNASEERKQVDYNMKQSLYLWFIFVSTDGTTQLPETLPARYSRILASLDIRYLSDQATAQRATPQRSTPQTGVPSWMERGLQNLYSLDTADRIADRRRLRQWYPVLPVSVGPSNPAKEMPLWADSVPTSYVGIHEVYARGNSVAATPIDQATVWADYYNTDTGYKTRDYTKMDDNSLAATHPLEEEAATQQMRFFFERFGNGAVVETLQRLGSGQSIDEALEETTGLNQAQFLAEWKKSRSKTE